MDLSRKCHTCHLLLGETREPGAQNHQRHHLTHHQQPIWSKTKNTPSSVFPNFRCLPIVVDSLHLGFLSSLRCTPPLPSALPALTGHPALRPIRAEQKSVPTNQRRACTELTIVLGSGCIPSKADLFEHHPITCHTNHENRGSARSSWIFSTFWVRESKGGRG